MELMCGSLITTISKLNTQPIKYCLKTTKQIYAFGFFQLIKELVLNPFNSNHTLFLNLISNCSKSASESKKPVKRNRIREWQMWNNCKTEVAIPQRYTVKSLKPSTPDTFLKQDHFLGASIATFDGWWFRCNNKSNISKRICVDCYFLRKKRHQLTICYISMI